MKLDKDVHKKIMLRILSDISGDAFLANNLGFKGGTACYFVYGLDRFSVDLDFDSLNAEKDELIKERLLSLLSQYGDIKTKTSIKLKYSDQYQALKIDLSTRHKNNKLNTYEVKDIVSGMPLKILKKEDIFAHKLVALISRGSSNDVSQIVIANRDLYDINFFFKKMWKFNEDIILLNTGKNISEYLQYAVEFIEKNVNDINILDRVGELVDDGKRNWIKKNFKKEVLKELAIQIAVNNNT
ncbi:nucleotidyl transferase AbiEii/AbiGii toxin family protein [Candidatus Parcubacteria bacterium]|nr:nucleotidyl transferase AbiEii/AbiGii toxin family protein [Candidatus Parcubacteria bacterium]